MIEIDDMKYKIGNYATFDVPQLTIMPSESWAFVGSNGSGKSSLAKALMQQLPILSGHITNQFVKSELISFELLQKMIEQEWQRNNTDMLSDGEDETGLTTEQVIVKDQQKGELCHQLAKIFGIEPLLTRRFKYLSTGETRKALLCRIMMSEPNLLVLDEPFDGLDVDSRLMLSSLLATLSSQGTTVVLILNRFEDIPAFIQKVGVLAKCQLIKTGYKEQLLADEIVKALSNTELLNVKNLPEADTQIAPLPIDVARVILNRGTVEYDNKAIIKNLTWQVHAHQNWQIVGPNGAGKSTLLSLITGDHPQGYSNDLTLFGRKRGSGETIWDIKKHIGYVSSALHLDYRVSSSVKNVLLSGYLDSIGVYCATSDKQAKLADEWLTLLNLSQHANQPFQSLSWGQQRLVLIARALVKYPTLLILDEPLQGLDPLNRELVKRWIDLLMEKGHSQLLFVSHHKEDAPKCITHRLTFQILSDSDEYEYQTEAIIA